MIKTYPVKHPTPAKMAETVKSTIERKTRRIQDYPRQARIATVQALHDLEFSQRKIGKLLGMGQDTVKEYIDAQISDQWVQYTSAIKKIMTEKNDVLRYKTANLISDKLQEGTKLKLYEITGLYKVLNDIERGTQSHNSQIGLTQVINVHSSLDRKPPEVDYTTSTPDVPGTNTPTNPQE